LLTNRQREILELMRTGMKVQAVARDLRLSEQTVRSHSRDICARLGVSGITAAIYRARALGIIS
jgi:LuxR family maltose regulon positive regulatory protein